MNPENTKTSNPHIQSSITQYFRQNKLKEK